MNRYKTSTPRAAFALAAIALTAMTLGLSVIVPAHVEASKTEAPTTIVVSDAPTRVARIDVVAVREPQVAAVPVRAQRPI
jgi:hypothetical protein